MKEQTFCPYYSFRVGEHEYAVKATSIREVRDHHDPAAITPVFHAPSTVSGYVNIRGEINVVLDLHRLLGLSGEPGLNRSLIFFQESIGPSFGILVDSTGDIFNIDDAILEPWHAQANDSRRERFTIAVYKAEGKLVSVLDPARFLIHETETPTT